jgi:3-dehydroquinate synthase
MPNVKVVVNLPDKPSYDVRIGDNIRTGLGARLRACAPDASQVLVISDSNVSPLYGEEVRAAARDAGFRTIDIVIPAGESSKSPACAIEVWRAMAQHRLDRDCVVAALGGGVVGDLAGFAAATYMRGVGFVQIPTTLLAMVDSSVGGKTGIDLADGKNLVGAFKQPLYVCADTATLSTLPDCEWACGCAEIAKSALIDSDEFFFWMLESADRLAARDPQTVREAIARCVVFKADVVAADEEERAGVRDCLNYGHTMGHAIEKLAGYGTFSHGQAVAEGMRFAIRLAAALHGTPLELVREQDELLDALQLPSLDFRASPDDMVDAMRGDKKARGGNLRFVLPHDIGSWTVDEVDEGMLREHLAAWERSKER